MFFTVRTMQLQFSYKFNIPFTVLANHKLYIEDKGHEEKYFLEVSFQVWNFFCYSSQPTETCKLRFVTKVNISAPEVFDLMLFQYELLQSPKCFELTQNTLKSNCCKSLHTSFCSCCKINITKYTYFLNTLLISAKYL